MDEHQPRVETLHATSASLTSSSHVTPPDAYKGYRVDSARLKGWDYSSTAVYFVTICTRESYPYFGDVVDGEVRLTAIGIVAGLFWQEIPEHHPVAICDEFVVMPNHVHGILAITRRDRDVAWQTGETAGNVARGDVACNVSTEMSRRSLGVGSLGVIVRSYKSAVSNWCHSHGHEGFAWQPRYHDHIIRNEKSLHETRRYIHDNPANWRQDEDNLL
ncbi:MAG: transposase [Chloroflexota bacterium]|nr:transposase [Chloroflexota bacterium]